MKEVKKEKCKSNLSLIHLYSDDLKFYLQNLKDQLGDPNIVFCLDAGGDSDDTMTVTTTLRGCLNFDLTV